MDVRQALLHVSEIRAHLARTETFRGYRSLTVGFSGLVGAAAAGAQALWLPQPQEQLGSYLTLWIGAAALSVLVIVADVWARARASQSAMSRRATLAAVEQFVPAVVVGALLTVLIARQAADSAWMLPGLWALVFCLGVFAACRQLPRRVALAGWWYLVGGVLSLAWGQGEAALSPWFMGVTFGGGQFLTAALLYFSCERRESGEE